MHGDTRNNIPLIVTFRASPDDSPKRERASNSKKIHEAEYFPLTNPSSTKMQEFQCYPI